MPATTVSITAEGISAPLGATVMPDGVNFSVFSRHATAVEILFFDGVDDARPTRTVRLDATPIEMTMAPRYRRLIRRTRHTRWFRRR